MPFVLLIVGAAFIAAGVQGKQSQLYSLLKNDLTGKNSYLSWVIAILIIGAIGYVEELKPISRAFMVLVIVVLFLSNGGFFQKFQQQVFPATNNSGNSISSSTGLIPNPFPSPNTNVQSWVNQIDPSLGIPVASATTN